MIQNTIPVTLDGFFCEVFKRWHGVTVCMHPNTIAAMTEYHAGDWTPCLKVRANAVVAPGIFVVIADNNVVATGVLAPRMPHIESVSYLDNDDPDVAYYAPCPLPGEQDYHRAPETTQ